MHQTAATSRSAKDASSYGANSGNSTVAFLLKATGCYNSLCLDAELYSCSLSIEYEY